MKPSTIAVHDLGGTGPTIVYAHATGFHALCWAPIAQELAQFHNVAFDASGHGDSPAPADWTPDWNIYGADAASVAQTQRVNGPIIGVGHSLGGAALLIAAVNNPDLFRGLLVYEPIVPPSFRKLPEQTPQGGNYLANGARRRRSSFASFDAALENFRAKPPLNIFAPEALEAYVRGGFASGSDGQVHLKCTPEHEARTYESAGLHDVWDRLREIRIPVWLICGRPEELQPSGFMDLVAEQIPGCRYIQLDHLGHFGPMQAPGDIAELIAEFAEFTR
jgi:pimeloyl-ACP methyl ester carboxylesterase